MDRGDSWQSLIESPHANCWKQVPVLAEWTSGYDLWISRIGCYDAVSV